MRNSYALFAPLNIVEVVDYPIMNTAQQHARGEHETTFTLGSNLMIAALENTLRERNILVSQEFFFSWYGQAHNSNGGLTSQYLSMIHHIYSTKGYVNGTRMEKVLPRYLTDLDKSTELDIFFNQLAKKSENDLEGAKKLWEYVYACALNFFNIETGAFRSIHPGGQSGIDAILMVSSNPAIGMRTELMHQCHEYKGDPIDNLNIVDLTMKMAQRVQQSGSIKSDGYQPGPGDIIIYYDVEWGGKPIFRVVAPRLKLLPSLSNFNR